MASERTGPFVTVGDRSEPTHHVGKIGTLGLRLVFGRPRRWVRVLWAWRRA